MDLPVGHRPRAGTAAGGSTRPAPTGQPRKVILRPSPAEDGDRVMLVREERGLRAAVRGGRSATRGEGQSAALSWAAPGDAQSRGAARKALSTAGLRYCY